MICVSTSSNQKTNRMSNGREGGWRSILKQAAGSAAGTLLTMSVVSVVSAIVGGAVALWLWTPVPSGAVVAFDLEECPDGWRRYVNADGRVIVGVQNQPASGERHISIRDRGGFLQHDLSEPTPLHSDYTRGPPSSTPEGPQGIPWLLKDRIDNMPPYIGLWFCTPE